MKRLIHTYYALSIQAPLIGICPFGGLNILNSIHGNPAPFSYVPNTMSSFSDKMSFYERFINAIISTLWQIGHSFYYLPKQDQIRKQVFRANSQTRNVWELEKFMSISLLNNHLSLSYPRPLVPTIIEVGGIHVSRKINKLPDDIERFIADSPNGVIYFSMGSNLRSDQMPDSTRDSFLSAFAELKQRVLWKWESDNLPGQPKNVKLGNWLPQQDILAHANVLLLITHGGLLSAQESIYHGKPLVGIPVFGDQALNMKKAEVEGYGLTLDLNNVTKASLLWAINTVLNTPSYREEAKKRSLLFRDQAETPLDRAIFWTEYVLRHKGAYHLQTQSRYLSTFQLYSIDILLLFIAFIVIIITLFLSFLRAISVNKKSNHVIPTDRKKKIQ